MGDAIERFEISVDDTVLDDLRERLARTRFPDQIPGTGWDYGTDLYYLKELGSYGAEASTTKTLKSMPGIAARLQQMKLQRELDASEPMKTADEEVAKKPDDEDGRRRSQGRGDSTRVEPAR